MTDDADAGRPASVDVVADAARVELDRIARRWRELPLDRAEERMPLLTRVLADLAPRSTPRLLADHPRGTAPEGGSGVGDPQEVEGVVPDLGPGVVIDQLVVLVWDAYAAGRGDGIPELLTALRRDLS